MKPVRLALVLLFALVILTTSQAVEEKYPGGKIKLKYEVDNQGRKSGPYLEYHENGKVKVKAACKDGNWDGAYATFHPSGKPHVTATYKDGKLTGAYTERTELGVTRLTATYKDGQLDGLLKVADKGVLTCVQECKDGEPVLPRTLAEVHTTIAAIEAPPRAKPADTLTAERQAALRHLMAYRYLVGVPYANLELDEEMNKCTTAGARLLEKIGKLDHTPANPGLPEAEYKLGYSGTSRSNLASTGDLLKALELYMSDSDPGNIDRLGHRRWCINPTMQKTGFGKSGSFSAMFSFDTSQKEIPDYDHISYPAAGFMPIQYFNADYAWNVSLNPKKYKEPSDKIGIKVLSQPDAAAKGKPPLKPVPLNLNYKKVSQTGFGIPFCIIFRPDKLALADGKRYWVEITGLEKKDGAAATLRYMVFFVNQD